MSILCAFLILTFAEVEQQLPPSQFTEVEFEVTFTTEVFTGPFNGNVVVYLSKNARQPKNGPNWLNPEPIYSAAFENVMPGQKMFLRDTNTIGFPGRLKNLEPGEYNIQAVVDRNLGGRAIGNSPGNIYSEVKRVTIRPGQNPTIQLLCNKLVPEREFQETKHVRQARVRSELLTKHYGRPTYLLAAVVLPEAWHEETERKFPVLYDVPGFGGTHWSLSGRDTTAGTLLDGEPFIKVYLNPDCPTGHSVFADSENNGPWGKALTKELIPYIEQTYRGWGKPEGRFVGGHSSGGWSSLWLQVAYPDFFGGCWSTAPDPIDFRDFQKINIYAPDENMFTDVNGQPRPLARFGNRVVIYYRAFSDMERPIRGEQLGSFEAVFSPKGSDGKPQKLWDRDTGKINPAVAQAWKKYDISHILRTRWNELEPKLKGKIRIYAGDQDTFYLEGAVQLLKEEAERRQFAMVIEILPGDHGSFVTRSLRSTMDKDIANTFRNRQQRLASRYNLLTLP